MKRAIRTLVRIIAAGLMVFGVLVGGLEYTNYRVQVRRQIEVHTNIWRYVIGGVLLVLGIILFAMSSSLAEQLSGDFEE